VERLLEVRWVVSAHHRVCGCCEALLPVGHLLQLTQARLPVEADARAALHDHVASLWLHACEHVNVCSAPRPVHVGVAPRPVTECVCVRVVQSLPGWHHTLTFLVADSNTGGNLNSASTAPTSSGLGGLSSGAGASSEALERDAGARVGWVSVGVGGRGAARRGLDLPSLPGGAGGSCVWTHQWAWAASLHARTHTRRSVTREVSVCADRKDLISRERYGECARQYSGGLTHNNPSHLDGGTATRWLAAQLGGAAATGPRCDQRAMRWRGGHGQHHGECEW
jgi:hypothetical protein